MGLLSSKGVYGLSAMYELFKYEQNAPMQTKEIAKRANIPFAYLEQLLSLLRHANLVKSIRGAKGGYVLAKDANSITVEEILIALEGELKTSDTPVQNSAMGIFLEECDSKIKEIFSISLAKLESFQNSQQLFYDI